MTFLVVEISKKDAEILAAYLSVCIFYSIAIPNIARHTITKKSIKTKNSAFNRSSSLYRQNFSKIFTVYVYKLVIHSENKKLQPRNSLYISHPNNTHNKCSNRKMLTTVLDGCHQSNQINTC